MFCGIITVHNNFFKECRIMKKLLSAVLAILMIMSVATFTSSVFALDTFTPDDGKHVVYVAKSGADGRTIFSDLDAAITAVDALGGGYVILADDFRKETQHLAAHSNMVIIRGADKTAGEAKTRLEFFYMNNLGGPVTFENIHLHWYQKEGLSNDDLSLNADYIDSSVLPSNYKVVMGKPGTKNDVEVSSFNNSTVYIRSGDITINSGSFGVVGGRYNTSPYYENFTVTLNDGNLTEIALATNGGSVGTHTTTINGDIVLNFNGGTTSFKNFTGNNSVDVKGNIIFNVSGTAFTGGSVGIFGGTLYSTKVGGTKIIDFSNHIGSASLPAVNEADWNIAYPRGKQVSDTFVLDSGSIESGVTYVGTTDDARIVVDGDVVLLGSTAFKNITIENGENGRIIANGMTLTIGADVKTAPNAEGKYIDIITGSVDGSSAKANVQIFAGTYNSIVNNGTPDSKVVLGTDVKTKVEEYKMNVPQIFGGSSDVTKVEASEFTDGIQVGKYTPAESENVVRYTVKDIDSNVLPYVRVEYYLNTEEGDEINATPYLKIGNNTIYADEALDSGWNFMNFAIAGNGMFSDFEFYPYGDAANLNEHNKMYVSAITFSLINDISEVSYSDPKWMAGNGDFVPDVADFVMDSQALVNPAGRTEGLGVDQTPFTNGSSVKLTPPTNVSDIELKYILTNANSLKADFSRYVRIEYFIYVKDGESFDDAYPRIVVPGYSEPFTAKQSIKPGWNVATFDIYDAEVTFPEFFFYPYGSAEVNEWNKIYVASITFSQTLNENEPAYGIPDVDEETGEVIPYIFNPKDLEDIPEKYAYLKDMPVVYYSNTGVYTGDAAGSSSSLRAYGDINKAISALEAVEGGYIILTTDLIMNGYTPASGNNPSKVPAQNDSISSHSNMIILRGMDADETSSGEKLTIGVGNVINFNGPVWLQNVYYEAVGINDEGLVSEEFHYGTPGAGDDDVVTKMGRWQSLLSGPSIGSSVSGGAPKKVDVTIHSGTFKGYLKAGGYYSGMTNSGDMYITIEGGDLRGMSYYTTHQNTHTTQGSAYINISGGKFDKTLGFAGIRDTMSSPCYIYGDLTVKITGGDFSAMAANSIYAEKYEEGVSDGVYGTRTIDILEYVGNSYEQLKNAISEDGFDVLNINAIYLDEENGNDENSGFRKNAPVQTLAKAISLVSYEENAKKYGGKIVLVGDYIIDEIEEETSHTANVLYTSEGGKLRLEAPFVLAGSATFRNIDIVTSDEGRLVANGNALVMDENVKIDGNLDIIGGTEIGTVSSVNVTVNSGTYRDIVVGENVSGNVNITINGGKITGRVVGGSSVENGAIGGSILITLNGGEFAQDSTVIASGEANDSTVGGGAEIYITGGDFGSMNQIQPGSSTVVGKTSVDYSKAPTNVASTVKGKIAPTFDVTVAPKMPAPEFSKSDRFIFIIKNIGDPTKALTKKIPFKVNQYASQTYDPVVVSPAQLKLDVDGNDNAIMTIQPINGVETIRLTPNASPTKGSQITIDGYNINGRGVNAGKHKYAEVIYYYTVPEGQTPVAVDMNMKFYGAHSSVPAQNSTPLVANKWTTALFDFTEAFAGNTDNITQYHLRPLGDGTDKGVSGPSVPEGQYIDIVSLTFYSDKPNTVVSGGEAPSEQFEEEDQFTPPVQDINVDLSIILTAVNGVDSFSALEKMFDGHTAVEYIPNRSYNGVMNIEGYGTPGKIISTMDYQYVIFEMYLKTETTVEYYPTITTQAGGLTNNLNPVVTSTYTAEKPLVPNQWNTVVIKITPSNPEQRNMIQVHIKPFGAVKNDQLAEGDVLYISEMTYSANAPKIEVPKTEEGVEGDEIEAEVIPESPAVIIAPEKLINSATDVKTFKSSLGEFDGKKVVMIKSARVDAPVTIDGAAIFGDTEQTPGGALSLKTHRYAVISYYYATSETETTRAPEFDLLGGRIQNMENVINGVTAAGTALKVNQWATAVVKLTGNGDGVLTSGFNLRPFGDTSARNISSDDVLYIENITFVSNRP